MIKDSGTRREYETGAVRDVSEGKGRCDLLPLDVVSEYLDSEFVLKVHMYQIEHDTRYLLLALREIAREWQIDPFSMMLEVSIHFEEGCNKYGERNWQKGIPEYCYIDSAIRHYLKWKRGDTDERHDRAAAWNIMCLIWTAESGVMNDSGD